MPALQATEKSVKKSRARPLSGKASKEICKKIGAAQAQKQALWIRAAHAHAFRAKVQAWSKVISGRAPVPRRRRHPSSHADWLACSCHHGGEAPRAMPCDRRARRARYRWMFSGLHGSTAAGVGMGASYREQVRNEASQALKIKARHDIDIRARCRVMSRVGFGSGKGGRVRIANNDRQPKATTTPKESLKHASLQGKRLSLCHEMEPPKVFLRSRRSARGREHAALMPRPLAMPRLTRIGEAQPAAACL